MFNLFSKFKSRASGSYARHDSLPDLQFKAMVMKAEGMPTEDRGCFNFTEKVSLAELPKNAVQNFIDDQMADFDYYDFVASQMIFDRDKMLTNEQMFCFDKKVKILNEKGYNPSLESIFTLSLAEIESHQRLEIGVDKPRLKIAGPAAKVA